MGDLEPDVLDYLRASDDFIYADADPLYERFHALLVSSRNVILVSILSSPPFTYDPKGSKQSAFA